MSDRPNDQKPDEPEPSKESRPSGGSWRTPEQAGTPEERHNWRAPDAEETPEAPQTWRVPTLPRDLDESSSSWHLPKPEDTQYTAEDESEIIPGDEAEAASAETPVEAPAEPAEQSAAEASPAAEETPVVAQPAAEVEAASEAQPVAEDQPVAESETSSEVSTESAEDADEEDEDDSFSMSELVALASLVDSAPSVEVQPAQSTSVTGVETALQPEPEKAAVDPAEYARQQLERLGQPSQSQQGGGVSTIAPPEEESSVVSPEEYARQQLEKLGAAAPAAGASPAVQEAAPVVEAQPAAPAAAEAEKFREAETKIRALRQQYQQGALTREQFQTELRRLMVLDENQVWWMMGVESDRWYRHDNGQWVPATPPALAADLGGEGDRTIPTTPVADQWVPARVPVRDPDFTVPGTGGIFLDRDLTADTIPIARVDAGETVPNLAIQQEQLDAVAAPMQADQVPSYEVEQATPTYADAVARQRQHTLRTVGIIAAIIAAILLLLGALGAIGMVVYYNSLVSPYRDEIIGLANYTPQFQTARIFAADGSLIAELTSPQGGARDEVTLDKIAPEMVHAVVSVENPTYFEDPGWSPITMAKNFIQYLTSGPVPNDNPTITEQVASNLVMQNSGSSSQIQVMAVAAEISRTYDKNFILQLYLNEVFFGNQSYGVQAASQFYFAHGADTLNLPESALLAGLIDAPATYDPVVNREASFDRMDQVLQTQANVGCLQFSYAPYNTQPFCITQQTITSPLVINQKAHVETAEYKPRQAQIKYPHFVNFVQQQIEVMFGTSEMFQRGFQIQTTLIPHIQDTAQSALVAQVQALSTSGVNTGAVMAIAPGDGAIRAMIGSPNFNDASIDGQVNHAFTWELPGNAITPVEYIGSLEGVALSNGATNYLTLASILWDVPTTFQNPTYTPVNDDGRFHGPVAERYALANSYNVPAVKALSFIGMDKFLDVAQRIGLRFLPDATFSLSTGVGTNEVRLYDMMQAYSTIANNGTRVPLYSITSIKDAQGSDVPLPPPTQPALALQPQIAFLMQNVLSDNEARTAAFGANSPLNIPNYPGLVAAKTGITGGKTDLWTMGFSSNSVVGVWMGRVDNSSTVNTTGLSAAPVWNSVMSASLQGTSPKAFNPPSGIVQQQICSDTGTLYDQSVPCQVVRTEYFIQSQPPPPANQGFVQTIPVDTWTGLRANQFCPDSVVSKTFVNISDPSAVAWLNTPEGMAYAASIGLPNPPVPAPTAECTPNTVLPQVKFTAPTNGQQVTGSVQFSGIVSGPNFAHYQIELAPSSSPDNFQIIAGPFGNQANGTLGTWDSTSVPNGAYHLRLAAFATDGGYRYDTIDIGVNNIIPTVPPPTLPPPVVPTSDFATPIPPQSVPPTGPTPTIFQGG